MTVTERTPGQAPAAALDGEVYSPAQIAARWSCSAETVRSLIKSGKLEGFRIGQRLIRVRADKLADYEHRRAAAHDAPIVPTTPEDFQREAENRRRIKIRDIALSVHLARRRDQRR